MNISSSSYVKNENLLQKPKAGTVLGCAFLAIGAFAAVSALLLYSRGATLARLVTAGSISGCSLVASIVLLVIGRKKTESLPQVTPYTELKLIISRKNEPKIEPLDASDEDALLQMRAINAFLNGDLEFFRNLRNEHPPFFAAFLKQRYIDKDLICAQQMLALLLFSDCENQFAILHFLLESKVWEPSFFSLPFGQELLIEKAIRFQKDKIVAFLLKEGKVNPNHYGKAPLLTGILSHPLPKVRVALGTLLLNYGADPDLAYEKDEQITTPFRECIRRGDVECFKLFSRGDKISSHLCEIFDFFPAEDLASIAYLLLPFLDKQTVCKADKNGKPLWVKVLEASEKTSVFFEKMVESFTCRFFPHSFCDAKGKNCFTHLRKRGF